MTSTEKTMKELAQEYLNFRRGLGFQLRTEGKQLLKFAEFVDQSDHSGPLTTELALRWACLPTEASPLYRARRLEVVRGFSRFRAIFDEGTEIPAQRLLGEAHRRTAPHVYSDREISDLLHAASRLSPREGMRPRTYQTLFGLLASTGLRILTNVPSTRSRLFPPAPHQPEECQPADSCFVPRHNATLAVFSQTTSQPRTIATKRERLER